MGSWRWGVQEGPARCAGPAYHLAGLYRRPLRLAVTKTQRHKDGGPAESPGSPCRVLRAVWAALPMGGKVTCL